MEHHPKRDDTPGGGRYLGQPERHAILNVDRNGLVGLDASRPELHAAAHREAIDPSTRVLFGNLHVLYRHPAFAG